MFTFDQVGDGSTSQAEVFELVGRPLAGACLDGYNATIFAYGQTGAGKTFTMMGPSVTDETRGLTPRVLEVRRPARAREGCF